MIEPCRIISILYLSSLYIFVATRRTRGRQVTTLFTKLDNLRVIFKINKHIFASNAHYGRINYRLLGISSRGIFKIT